MTRLQRCSPSCHSNGGEIRLAVHGVPIALYTFTIVVIPNSSCSNCIVDTGDLQGEIQFTGSFDCSGMLTIKLFHAL